MSGAEPLIATGLGTSMAAPAVGASLAAMAPVAAATTAATAAKTVVPYAISSNVITPSLFGMTTPVSTQFAGQWAAGTPSLLQGANFATYPEMVAGIHGNTMMPPTSVNAQRIIKAAQQFNQATNSQNQDTDVEMSRQRARNVDIDSPINEMIARQMILREQQPISLLTPFFNRGFR